MDVSASNVSPAEKNAFQAKLAMVAGMSGGKKRAVYRFVRGNDYDTFLPDMGMTLGEITLAQVVLLKDTKKET